ncbi:MAG TPA: hypothetical protein ENI45_00110 [Thermoplasmatales archaeon]|nr:hypothetical protein [Thermoplasmatales archaeon]
MKTSRKFLIMSVISIIILQCFVPLSSAEPENEKPLDKIFKLLFEVLAGKKILPPYMAPFSYFLLIEPKPIKAYPSVINVEYLNQTEIIIGAKEGEDKWVSLINLSGTLNWGWFYQSLSFRFEFVPPEDSPSDAWIAYFEPKIITLQPSKETTDWKATPYDSLKTKLTLKLNPSYNASYPTQDTVIKVKVIRREVIGNIITPPKYHIGFWSNPLIHLIWPLFSGPMFQWINYRSYNGFIWEEEIFPPVEILIKVKKDHFAEIIPPPPMEIHPNEVLSIPVAIKNLGSHIDTFNFRVNTTDVNLKVSPPSAVTLNPGETKQTMLSVAAPPILWDVGTTRSIIVEAYSIEEPDKVFSNAVILTSRGVYVSEINIVYLIVFLLIIITSVFFFLHRKKRPPSVKAAEEKAKVLKKEKTIPAVLKPPERKKEEPVEKPSVRKREMEKRLLKIKREQEKQRRKLKT